MIRVEIEVAPNKKAKPSDFHDAFVTWYAYMQKQTDEMFVRAGGPGSAEAGGSYRGVTWDPFAPQYIRKTDGATVYAWGGTPKLRGSGMVKPRLRPSGQPITPASLLMQDTGRLRQRAATDIVRITPTTMAFGTNLEYAAAQQDMRPFLFVTEEDADKLADLVAKKIEEAFGGEIS